MNELNQQLEPLLIPPIEAARFLGIGKTLLYQMASDGRLGPVPVMMGSKTLYRREELAEWVRRVRGPPVSSGSMRDILTSTSVLLGTTMKSNNDKFINKKDVASRLSLSPRTVDRLDSSGRLPAGCMVGGSKRWRESDITLFIQMKAPDRRTFEAMKEANDAA